ncbi:MAG: asparaginase [Gammaproteobacteria bacterium]|nr:asparaginase [Gammaproteobacteria bacterium]
MLKIRIFTVGGTIDKIYFDAKSRYEVGPPNIAMVLADLSLNMDYSVRSLMQKDSLEMNDSDRDLILQHVQTAEEDKIIITHGTDTMTHTAAALATVENKTVVLTGALQPALFKNSDAMFNIGCAIAAVQTLPANIYIAMNGQIFTHDNVCKDLKQNRFTTLQ